MNEIWDGNKGPEDLSNEFSDFFKLSKRGYFLNDFDDSMKNHMYDSPLPPLTALNPIEKMPVKKDVDQKYIWYNSRSLTKRFFSPLQSVYVKNLDEMVRRILKDQ